MKQAAPRIILHLVLLLSTFSVQSQPNIQYDVLRVNKKCFKNIDDFYYFDIFCTSHGSIFASGGTDASNSDARLSKLNNNFDTIWTKTYGGSNDDRWLNIMELPDGKLVLAGTTSSHDGDVWYGHTYTAREIWVVIADTNGNLIKGKTFGGSNGSELLDCFVSSDGNIYLSGTTIANDYDFVHVSYGSLDSDPWIAKLDSSLNLKWAKCYNGNSLEGTSCFQEINNNRFVYGITTGGTDTAMLGSQSIGNNDILVGVVDSMGNTVWKKRFGTFGGDDVKRCYVDKQNAYIYFLASNGQYGTDVNYATGIGNNWILKIDTNAQVLASSAYGLTGINPIRAIDFKFFGGHLWCTSETDLGGGDVGPNTTGYTNAWIAMVDSNCHLVGKHTIDGNRQDYVFDHSLIVVNNDLYYYGMTLGLSPNTEGCNTLVDTLCAHIEKLITQPLNVYSISKQEEKLIQISPNPSQHNLFIEKLIDKPCELRVTDNSGKEVFTSKLKKSKTFIDCSSWPIGFYVITAITMENKQSIQFIKN